MTLRLTSAPVAGIQKRKSAKSALAKSRGSPFAAHARRKPKAAAAGVKAATTDFGADEPLPDKGASLYISKTTTARNVEEAIEYIGTQMFDELPQRAGMNNILDRIGPHSALSQGVFTTDEYRALMRAGFLVSSSTLTQGTLNIASLPNLPGAAASSASRSSSSHETNQPTQGDSHARAATLFLSLPNTGTYLRLLSSARAHLLALLRRSHCAEAPLGLLKDRWDGAVETDKSFHLAKRARGEFAGILPGKTKKWKDMYGMQFRWVLEEALGAGLVEIFETGSVGPGIRCL
ncbi:hypothetical protein N7493_003486 [Penicillium malachiteum]|uniref:Serine-threonine protein kinase 19 n=1 Tax=Penicillium malachiteum TaxID=1324776 RepID=A0AAD6MXM8_9EURO|nr:hypothetical protein N7493_003486 [Penicillium malachiteum]